MVWIFIYWSLFNSIRYFKKTNLPSNLRCHIFPTLVSSLPSFTSFSFIFSNLMIYLFSPLIFSLFFIFYVLSPSKSRLRHFPPCLSLSAISTTTASWLCELRRRRDRFWSRQSPLWIFQIKIYSNWEFFKFGG